VADLFEEWLHQHYPLKAEHVMNRIRECRGGKVYDATFHQRQRGSGSYADLIGQRFRLICKKLGLDQSLPPLRTDLFRKPAAGGQMSFDFFD
jgi:DNA repair photolyase